VRHLWRFQIRSSIIAVNWPWRCLFT